MASQIAPAKAYFPDQNGRPLAGGKVYMYFVGTENKKDTFQDRALSIPNTNPIVLDSYGEALIWGSGSYRQILTDRNDVQIWDQVVEDSNASLTGNMTDVVFKPGDGTGNTFIPGTTTVLTLPVTPGSISDTWLFFDGTYQTDDQIASIGQFSLTLVSPIPTWVGEVTIKIGSTIAVGTPSNGSVVDASVANGAAINASKISYIQAGATAIKRTLLSKLQEFVSVTDFGAKGDGVNDDTAAIQACINFCQGLHTVLFPTGNYLLKNGLTAVGGVSIKADPNAVLVGASTLNATMLSISAVNTGTQPIQRTSIIGLTFAVNSNSTALYIHNATFMAGTIEPGPVIEDCCFTSYGYTTVGNAPLTTIQQISNARFTNCSWFTYTANGLNGINQGIFIFGSANTTFEGCQWHYNNNAITMANDPVSGILTQGIFFSNCTSNGCFTTITSSNTNDCMFNGCIFDNHQGPSILSSNDAGLAIMGCYFGSSDATTTPFQISVAAGNPNQLCRILNSSFVQYVANSSGVMFALLGVAGTFYNNAIIDGCQFRNGQFFTSIVQANFVANSVMSNCVIVGTPTGMPVLYTNGPLNVVGLRCVNNIGANLMGPLVAGNPYPAPTVLATLGSGNFYANTYPFDCDVYITGGTITGVQLAVNGRTSAIGPQSVIRVPQGGQINVSFTGSPSWIWVGL